MRWCNWSLLILRGEALAMRVKKAASSCPASLTQPQTARYDSYVAAAPPAALQALPSSLAMSMGAGASGLPVSGPLQTQVVSSPAQMAPDQEMVLDRRSR